MHCHKSRSAVLSLSHVLSLFLSELFFLSHLLYIQFIQFNPKSSNGFHSSDVIIIRYLIRSFQSFCTLGFFVRKFSLILFLYVAWTLQLIMNPQVKMTKVILEHGIQYVLSALPAPHWSVWNGTFFITLRVAVKIICYYLFVEEEASRVSIKESRSNDGIRLFNI